jgi:hypothetical protein
MAVATVGQVEHLERPVGALGPLYAGSVPRGEFLMAGR